MEIKGQIKKIYFTNMGTSAILVDSVYGDVRAFGKITAPNIGCDIEMEGDYKINPKYGMQFDVVSSTVSKTLTEEGIIAYLSSGFIKGVGEKIAKRIVNKFGKNTLNVIEMSPKKLLEVSGISEAKMESICKTHDMHSMYAKLIDFFNGLATDYQIRTIYEKYKEKSIEVLKENPYVLIDDVKGFGFKKADALAQKSGIAKNDIRRVCAAIVYVLESVSVLGHCYVNEVTLIKTALEELKTPEITEDKIKTALKQRIDDGSVIDDGGRIYLKDLFEAEQNSAKIIAKMIKDKKSNFQNNDIDYIIEKFEKENDIELEDKQREAVKSSVENKLSVITGGPGTGKTTIINAILYVLNYKNKIPVRLVAPTGKAAKRISESVENQVIATTVHKLIYNENLEDDGFLIVDETSMVDINLASKMLKLVEMTNSNLILIGDMYQLPSIGPGNFFRDLIDNPLIKTTTLDLCYRQTGNIAYNAKKINQGSESWKLNDDSFEYLLKESQDVQKTVLDEYLKLYKKYDLKDICCIVPTRQAPKNNDLKNKTCSDTLNELIRERINPQKSNMPKLNGCKFRVGDRIMNTVNDYERMVFNGDCGVVIDIDEEENNVWVEYDDGSTKDYSPCETSNLKLAYAMTVHKSQGSEYKAIVMAQAKEHYILLQRNLLYTGITRASEKVVLVADKNSVRIALNKNDAITRATQLKQKINNYYTQ